MAEPALPQEQAAAIVLDEDLVAQLQALAAGYPSLAQGGAVLPGTSLSSIVGVPSLLHSRHTCAMRCLSGLGSLWYRRTRVKEHA